MRTAIDQFKENISRIRSLHAVHASINSQTTGAIDLSDILRAEYVLLVSALDYYIHQVVRIGMLEIFSGQRPSTATFEKFDVSLSSVKAVLNDSSSVGWLEDEIRTRHGWRSFQEAKKVGEALKLISDKNIWEEITKKQGEDAKKRLNLIVDRRNKIAHEADMHPAYFGERWFIKEADVEGAIDFIESLVSDIHDILTS